MPTSALAAPTVRTIVSSVRARGAAREVVDDRDEQEERQLLAVGRRWPPDRARSRPRAASAPRSRRAARRTRGASTRSRRVTCEANQHSAGDRQQDLRDGDRQLRRGDHADERRQPDQLEPIARRRMPGRQANVVTVGRLPLRRHSRGAAITCSGRDQRQTPEIARHAVPLMTRPAGQRPGVDRDRRGPARSRHGIDRSGSVGPNSATIGVARRRRDVQRPAVAADVQRRARRPARAARQIELAAAHDARGRVAGARAARRPRRDRPPRASDGPEVMIIRRAAVLARQRRRDVGEVLRRPAPERIAGADVDDDDRRAIRRRRRLARRASTDRRRLRILRHLDRVARRDPRRAMPSGVSRSHWFSTEWRGGTSDRVHGTRVV